MKIGIMGVKGSGKDTAAAIISKQLNIPQVAFAKPLHEAVIHIWGKQALERDQKEQQQIFGEGVFEWFYSYHRQFMKLIAERYGLNSEEAIMKQAKLRDVFSINGRIYDTISPREFMQKYGTDFMRSLRDDIWIRIAEDQAENCVFSDVRFQNEADVCDVLLFIDRQTDSNDTHISEQFTHTVAFPSERFHVIENNGTLEEFEAKVLSFVEQELVK